jgi:hypothetical protein
MAVKGLRINEVLHVMYYDPSFRHESSSNKTIRVPRNPREKESGDYMMENIECR